ncbi:hemolysin-III related-domain-containing protein [Cladochytrium replicatum]|nr:hemolysin-III related-domain-containing protein [Cladochytrium replicatum]
MEGIERAGTAARDAYDAAVQSLTCTFRELPNWCHDNTFIVTGYRHIQHSYKGCVDSLFYIHNETGNVYTHLVGAVAFMALFFVTFLAFTPDMETTQWSDYLVISVFLGGAVACLMLSTLFHLFQCHSLSVCKAWNKADYIGIVVLIVSSFVPAIYYGFLCNPVLQIAYLTFICVFGIATVITSVSSRFSTPEWRLLRTSMFLAMGLSGIIPLVHAGALYGFNFINHAMSMQWMIVMGILYVVGALIYASRVPERWWPGKFDLWFHSHQIFHVLVVAAAVTHYIGVMNAYRFWHKTNLVSCPANFLVQFSSMTSVL